MRTWAKIALATLSAILLCVLALTSSYMSQTVDNRTSTVSRPASIISVPDSNVLEVNDIPYVPQPVPEYPYGWLAADEPSIGAHQGQSVRILYCPGLAFSPRIDGEPNESVGVPLDIEDPSLAYIVLDMEAARSGDDTAFSAIYSIDPRRLLVNLPDIVPAAVYDIRYAYDTPSRSGGHDIEGLTGAVLPGYIPEMQFDTYLCKDVRPVPAAYELAMKLTEAQSLLMLDGYRLVVWDCYRPYRASRFISEKFTDAYNANSDVRQAVGDTWGLSWYAASGTSGHNFGSDIDVSIADAGGNTIEMPSDFDAFDDSAHLVDYPMSSSSITPDAYRQEVRDNPACMAFHQAMTSVGLSELASEWWHFSDKEAESSIKDAAGTGGLDFEARL